MSPTPMLKLNNGRSMPAIGFGTWQAEDKELEKALGTALTTGYRHIDTATVYFNEQVIGKVLHSWFTTGKLKREDVFVTTKLPFYGNRASSVEKFLKRSLTALKVDYVDMYLIHAPFGFQDADEGIPVGKDGKVLLDTGTDHVSLWKAMEEQVKAGRAKSIGLSNFNEKQIGKILKNCSIPPANLQIELHVYFQQKPLMKYCEENKIVVTSYSSLGSRGTFKKFGKNFTNMLENETVLKIAKKHAKTAPQILLRFLVQKDIAVIPKSTNEKRIKENFQITSFKLDDKEMEMLTNLDQGEKGRVILFEQHFLGVDSHPEFPYKVLRVPEKGVK